MNNCKITLDLGSGNWSFGTRMAYVFMIPKNTTHGLFSTNKVKEPFVKKIEESRKSIYFLKPFVCFVCQL
jgi:hypothetical protein